MAGPSKPGFTRSGLIQIHAEENQQDSELSSPTRFCPLPDDSSSDIIFICGEDLVPIKAHKVVLKDCSEFLNKAIKSALAIRSFVPIIPFIVIKELDSSDLRDILQFIYYGNVSIKRHRVTSFLKAARYLQIKNLSELTVDDLLESSNRFRQRSNRNSDGADGSTLHIEFPLFQRSNRSIELYDGANQPACKKSKSSSMVRNTDQSRPSSLPTFHSHSSQDFPEPLAGSYSTSQELDLKTQLHFFTEFESEKHFKYDDVDSESSPSLEEKKSKMIGFVDLDVSDSDN